MTIKRATKPESTSALLKRSLTLYRQSLWHVFGFAALFTAVLHAFWLLTMGPRSSPSPVFLASVIC